MGLVEKWIWVIYDDGSLESFRNTAEAASRLNAVLPDGIPGANVKLVVFGERLFPRMKTTRYVVCFDDHAPKDDC